VAEFAIQGNKWKRNAVTYGFNEFTPDLTQPEIQSAVAEAFGLWQAVIPLSFTQVPIASTPDIVIRFVGGDHGDGFPFDSVGGVIAHAFFPPPKLAQPLDRRSLGPQSSNSCASRQAQIGPCGSEAG
jgi:Matrixin